MFTKKLIAAALFALAPFAAQAALTTLPPGWPPAGSTGLAPVQFNQVNIGANGAFVAMGAHAYKNGPTLANDGVSKFWANSGVYRGEPTKNYANWSFDFAYDTAGCTTCNVFLEVDRDFSAGIDYVRLFDLTQLTAAGTNVLQYGQRGADAWNMEMAFMTALVGDFNPFIMSSTAFRLVMVDSAGVLNGTSAITVDVPEPGTMALAGLALAGMSVARRRKAIKGQVQA